MVHRWIIENETLTPVNLERVQYCVSDIKIHTTRLVRYVKKKNQVYIPSKSHLLSGSQLGSSQRTKKNLRTVLVTPLK